MTNLELMLLEHAARFEYSDYSIKRKSQELFVITLEGDFANVAACIRLYMNKNCAKTFATFDERKGDDVVLKVKITCGTVTDVVQMIDKLSAPLREWYADLDELRNLSKVYPKQPQQFKTPNSPTTDLPPMPQPSSRCDDFIAGVIKRDAGAPIAESLQGNVIVGTERLFMIKDDATAHASTPAIQLNDEMKATVEAFTGTVCGAPLPPPPPPKEKGE